MDSAQEPSGRRRKRVSPAAAGERCRNAKDRDDPAGKKEGPSEAYVRGLETLLALSISNIDGLESKILSLLPANPAGDVNTSSSDRRQKLLSLWTDENASENLCGSWKASKLSGELEKLMSAAEADSATTTTTSLADLENYGLPPSYPTPDSRLSYKIGGEYSDVGDSEAPKRKRMRLDGGDKPRITDLGLPPEAPQLLETYFSYTHTWFPVVTKHAILRTSYLYSAQPMGISRTTTGSGDHAALWAILSYITAQSRPHAGPSSSSSSSSLDQPGFFRDPVSKVTEFYTNARSLIPLEEERFELGHIQALLVLTLVNFGIGDWTAAWLLSGQTTRLAIGLQSDENSSSAGKHSAGQVNAVVLGCFVVDTILSARLKATPHMREDDIRVGLLEEDGLEEWGPWSDVLSSCQTELPGCQSTARGPLLALSCFNRLVELARLLSRIAIQDPSDPGTPEFCQSMLRDIQTWREKLPPNCHLEERDLQGLEKVPPFLLPHQSFLCFTYLGIVSFFHMRFSALLQSSDSTLEKALQVGTIILAAHARNFGPAVLPPILEHSVRTIIGGARLAAPPTRQEETHHRFSVWLECMNRYTTKTARVWPVMRSLMRSLQPEPSEGTTFSMSDHNPSSGSGNPLQSSRSDSARETAAWCDSEESLSTLQPYAVDYDDIFQTDQDDALLDILGLDWNFNPQTNTTTNDANDVTSLPSALQEQGDLHLPSLDDVLAYPDIQLPPSAAEPQPQAPPNTKLPDNNSNGNNPTQLSTPESMFSTPSVTSRNPQRSSPPPRTASRAKRPAPNEIESIFDENDDVVDLGVDVREGERSQSSPLRPSASSARRRASSAVAKDSSNTKLNANTVMDLDALSDPLDIDGPLRSSSRSASMSEACLLAPPPIGDLWPPPGFFPQEREEKRGEGMDRGERG